MLAERPHLAIYSAKPEGSPNPDLRRRIAPPVQPLDHRRPAIGTGAASSSSGRPQDLHDS